jgi:hypothetical protein
MRNFLCFLGFGILLLGCSLSPSSESLDTPSLQSLETESVVALPSETQTGSGIKSTETPTPTVTPIPEILEAQQYAVVFLSEGSPLEVQAFPGSDQPVIARLGPHSTGITHTQNYRWFSERLWIEINIPGGGTGWVKADNLTPQIDSHVFCLDSRIEGLISQFTTAVESRDGFIIKNLVSPVHGLKIRHEWWNPEVRFPAGDQLALIFNDRSAYDWGMQNGSGLPIQGSFLDVIVPALDEGLAEYSRHCNTLEQGVAESGSGGYTEWPFEYVNLNYYSLYHPAPASDELGWRTWVLGFELIGDQPYLVVLVQYHWEI